MRFRTGLFIGLGTGYVLGAKAGRQRYEQIQAMWHRLRGDEVVQALVKQAVDATAAPRDAARQAVSDKLRSASTAIQERTPPNGERSP
jgi:hypothetical protein